MALVLTALLGCTQSNPQEAGEMSSEMQKVTFLTKDSVTIHANYWKAESSRAAILVHQFNSSKEAYAGLAKLLNEDGYGVLALDLRGHGESRSKGSLANPAYLSDKDFQNMHLDLAAAQKFLSEKGYTDFFIAGSSIGANLAIIYPFEGSGFKAAVALSPGEDFKSLLPLEAAQKTGVPTMIVASKEDAYSFESAEKIHAAMTGEKKLVKLENAGHGTSMLQNNPSLVQQILEWFELHA
ncbi:MAG: alpha/beta fold hydrolase [Candidatus Diapherotrites archaeon]|nr:alpha/beta fold hydrolase [Candidatus Diapherotrites archaeon]